MSCELKPSKAKMPRTTRKSHIRSSMPAEKSIKQDCSAKLSTALAIDKSLGKNKSSKFGFSDAYAKILSPNKNMNCNNSPKTPANKAISTLIPGSSDTLNDDNASTFTQHEKDSSFIKKEKPINVKLEGLTPQRMPISEQRPNEFVERKIKNLSLENNKNQCLNEKKSICSKNSSATKKNPDFQPPRQSSESDFSTESESVCSCSCSSSLSSDCEEVSSCSDFSCSCSECPYVSCSCTECEDQSESMTEEDSSESSVHYHHNHSSLDSHKLLKTKKRHNQ